MHVFGTSIRNIHLQCCPQIDVTNIKTDYLCECLNQYYARAFLVFPVRATRPAHMSLVCVTTPQWFKIINFSDCIT